jgi:hypothetical protein
MNVQALGDRLDAKENDNHERLRVQKQDNRLKNTYAHQSDPYITIDE